MADVNLGWDELLDDYEVRIRRITRSLDTGAIVETPDFVPPVGDVEPPSQAQVARFRELQGHAAVAAGALLERLDANRQQAKETRRATEVHKAYLVADGLG
ncbi:MAG: hypothetical protein GY708_02790 [Actinomycetia bacterium]|nr:hypothetical protein [Actinomycetes bacterium]MCP4960873.1 hypothetical protein [Actinomycetes bacterium]